MLLAEVLVRALHDNLELFSIIDGLFSTCVLSYLLFIIVDINRVFFIFTQFDRLQLDKDVFKYIKQASNILHIHFSIKKLLHVKTYLHLAFSTFFV